MKTHTTEPMNASLQFCPNLACSARGQVGQGNIVVHGRTRPRYQCKTCGRTFSAKAGTALEGLRKPTELIVIVMTLLSYGCPLQAIVHAFDLDERTVASWRDRAGKQCERVHQAIIEQGKLDLLHVQANDVGDTSLDRLTDQLADGAFFLLTKKTSYPKRIHTTGGSADCNLQSAPPPLLLSNVG